jgi:hypothetical protein
MTLGPNRKSPPYRTAAQRGKTNFARLTKTDRDLREAARHNWQARQPRHKKTDCNPATPTVTQPKTQLGELEGTTLANPDCQKG